MKAERQQKEPQKADPIQSKRERSKLSFIDNRPQTASQTKLIQSIQKKENKTGLPDNLKTGMENLSGFSMDDVRVHYNSSRPAQLNALAYAQGTDIHVAPGQEKHIPHEAWHVVQQKQGRVQPTMQLLGRNVNDNQGLEMEADVMGSKAFVNAITLQRKEGDESSGETTQKEQSWPNWTLFGYNVPGILAGTLDFGFGLKNLISTCYRSRQYIPKGSKVTIPQCIKGKVDGAKVNSKRKLTGGTYTIEVGSGTDVEFSNDFIPEDRDLKTIRALGPFFSMAAGATSVASSTVSFCCKNLTTKGAWIFSLASGLSYTLANIPKLKSCYSKLKGCCSKNVPANNPGSEQASSERVPLKHVPKEIIVEILSKQAPKEMTVELLSIQKSQ